VISGGRAWTFCKNVGGGLDWNFALLYERGIEGDRAGFYRLEMLAAAFLSIV
jgi:hypothetical protein